MYKNSFSTTFYQKQFIQKFNYSATMYWYLLSVQHGPIELHSICNNIWSHSKLNLHNEDEIISGALTFIPGFQTSLPFKSWTVQSFTLFSVFNSLSCHTSVVHPRCQIEESLFFVSCFIVTSMKFQVGWKNKFMKL